MITINCQTEQGGAVEFNKDHGIWASYAVATVGDIPPAELFYTGAKLKDGSTITFFLNRESGLIVIDHIHKSGKKGVELLRRKV